MENPVCPNIDWKCIFICSSGDNSLISTCRFTMKSRLLKLTVGNWEHLV